jgi:uncharacterized membrane protein YqaE (UPF0057 family)
MTTATEIARACDQYVSALWRGESEAVGRFSTWLRHHWALGPEEPSGPPNAFSVVGGGGAGIRWHEIGPTIYGYIPGVAHRCYQIPKAASPPVIGG